MPRRSIVRVCWLVGGLLFVATGGLSAEYPGEPPLPMEDYRQDFGSGSGPRGRPSGTANGTAITRDGLALTDLLGGEAVGVWESDAIAAPVAFTAVGPHWIAEIPTGTGLRLELSTSPDGVEWSDFHEVYVDPHLVPTERFADGTPNPAHGHTMGGLTFRSRGDGRFVRYRAILSREAGTTATPVLRHLTLTFIDSRHRPAGAERDLADPGRTTEVPEVGGYPKPPVNSRGAWGAIPPTCTYAYCNVTHIATHHTAGVGEYSCDGFDDCAADVRAIQAFHMFTNGWCDMGYNYLVSSDGQLWEGRGGGDDVRGAHDGFNCGSMGVSNMGYYHPPFDHVWTEAQLDAEAELGAWKADQKGIDPFGVGFYAGFGGNMDNFYGHRDVSATACPGDNIYTRLGELRNRVSDKLAGGGTELIFDNPAVDRLTGDWTTGTSSDDKYGADYYWTSTGTPDKRLCLWKFDLPSSGLWEVSFWWPEGSNRTPAGELGFKQNELNLFTADQQTNGGQWNSFGTYALDAGEMRVGLRNGGPSGWVIVCDAIRLAKVD